MLPILLDKWHHSFGKLSPAIIVRAPGRVNIIGEHTDYNNGWVLPGAMSRSLYILISKSTSPNNHWIANELDEEFYSNDSSTLPAWAKYIAGAVSIYAPEIGPLQILIGGDLPIGAGMSSSSALTCGILLALQELTGGKETKEEIALLASRVEREVIGVQGGIMDQYAIMMSQPDHVMLLDCRSKEYRHIEANLEDCKWVLINTKVKHQLINTDYNQRALECTQAVKAIQSTFPEVESLRDVTIKQIAAVDLPENISQRARFVVEENERVLQMVKALEKKDATCAGRLLAESHEGLKTLYEVSCDELDHLADFANQQQDVHGARMMGGGFGGCVICLIKKTAIPDFEKSCAASYMNRFGLKPDFIHFELGQGAERIK